MKCMWFIGAVFACGCALAVEIPDLCVRALRRALDSRAAQVNDEMKVATSYALANLVSDSELCEKYIIPSPLDERVVKVVRDAVIKAAHETGVARI